MNQTAKMTGSARFEGIDPEINEYSCLLMSLKEIKKVDALRKTNKKI